MEIVSGTGDIAREPDWSLIYSADDDKAAAARHWASVTRELRDAGTLAEVNGSAIERLVDLRLVYDKARKHVAEHGTVIPPKRGNKAAIARPSPHWGVMLEAAAAIDRTEAELGISPRRRGAVTKVDRKQRARQAADSYLKVAK